MSTTGPRFLVRFFPRDVASERTVGVGFLVAEQHVLTCAHVVNQALGRDPRAQDPPTERDLVYLEFPLADDALCRARVTRWEPPPTSGIRGKDGADIAGLAIVGVKPPPGVIPARLTSGATAGCQVDIFGVPSGMARPDGIWVHGRVSGEVAGGLLQINADLDRTWQAQSGFSGAPVIDRATGAVIGMFKAASTNEGHRDSYAIPTGQLRAAWADVLVVLPPNPHKGLATFTPADAELFLGRDDEKAELLRKVRRHPFVLVIGPSGVGKSSLVQAGLIPELVADGWGWVVCRPSEHPEDPFHVLAAALRRAEDAARPDVDKQRAWAAEIRATGLARLAADLRTASGRRTLLVVDQIEELFRFKDGNIIADFLDRLLELPDTLPGEHPLAVVATLRADFYHRFLEHTGAAPRLADRRIDLSPLSRAALREVIETPARNREVHYADHLVTKILTDASTSEGALPLLEFALTELWNHQRCGRISHEAYHEIGEVLGSIDQQAEHAVAQLLSSGVSERDVERTLLALISSSSREDIPATSRSCPSTELNDTQRQVAEALTRARLLTATERNQQACYELAHEALIGSWQRLHRTAEADREFLRWRTQLEQWDEQRHGLLPETWVVEGTDWCAQRDDIPPRLADLVRRSQEKLTVTSPKIPPSADDTTVRKDQPERKASAGQSPQAHAVIEYQAAPQAPNKPREEIQQKTEKPHWGPAVTSSLRHNRTEEQGKRPTANRPIPSPPKRFTATMSDQTTSETQASRYRPTEVTAEKQATRRNPQENTNFSGQDFLSLLGIAIMILISITITVIVTFYIIGHN